MSLGNGTFALVEGSLCPYGVAVLPQGVEVEPSWSGRSLSVMAAEWQDV